MAEFKALVVGARGFLGTRISDALRQSGYSVCGTTSMRTQSPGMRRLDLREDVPSQFSDEHFDVAVIAAGLTSVKACDANPRLSFSINVTGRVAVSKLLMSRGTHLVLISSDAVFSGDSRVVSSSQAPDARSVYGRHMAQSESEILEFQGAVSVIRLGKVMHSEIPILKAWLEGLKSGNSVSAFTDSRVAPISPGFAVDAVQYVVENRVCGIIHATGVADASWFDIAQVVAESIGVPRTKVTGLPCDSASDGRKHAALPTTHELPAIHLVGIEAVRQTVRDLRLGRS